MLRRPTRSTRADTIFPYTTLCRSAGLRAEGRAQHLHLGDEVPVPVNHALGHAGRAAGEQDRGDVVGLRVAQLRPGAGTVSLDLRQRGVGPPRSRAGGPAYARRLRPAQRSEERRVGKECVRPCRSLWSPDNKKTKTL